MKTNNLTPEEIEELINEKINFEITNGEYE